LISDISAETLQARREWYVIFIVVKEKKTYQPRLYTTKLCFKHEGEINFFPDKQKLKEFIITLLVFTRNGKGILHMEVKGY
jgi:hypothetical protein